LDPDVLDLMLMYRTPDWPRPQLLVTCMLEPKTDGAATQNCGEVHGADGQDVALELLYKFALALGTCGALQRQVNGN